MVDPLGSKHERYIELVSGTTRSSCTVNVSAWLLPAQENMEQDLLSNTNNVYEQILISYIGINRLGRSEPDWAE